MVARAGESRPERFGADPSARRGILFVTPFSLDANPYASQLTAALTAAGADVRIARGKSPIVVWRGVRAGTVPACVHLQWQHGFFTGSNLPAAVFRTALFFLQWAALRLSGVRFVWTIHNIVNHEQRQAGWELIACRMLARCVDAIVAHCDEAANTVAAAYRIPRARVRVIPHGAFDTDSAPPRAAARRQLGLDDQDLVLLCFGRIRRYKGVERLIDAFAVTPGAQLRLFIVGAADDPALAAELARRAAGDPRIRLRLEHVPAADLAGYLSACDAAVLPYRDSLTSGAAVLAAAHARAIIAPRIGCLCDFPADSGVYYEAGDRNGLAAALGTATSAPLAELGAAASAYVRLFPWSVVAQRTIALYAEVAPAFSTAPSEGGTRLPEGRSSPILRGLRDDAETASSEQVPAAGAEAHVPVPPMVNHAK